MAIRPIVEVPDPRLREISKPVKAVDPDVRALVADMFETMYAAPGIGLAAIQVGVPQRILVIDLQEPEEEDGEPIKDPRVFINPEILETSEQDVPYTEGCLSVPDQFAEVDRPDRIRPRWQAARGRDHRPARDLPAARDGPPQRRPVHRSPVAAEAGHDPQEARQAAERTGQEGGLTSA